MGAVSAVRTTGVFCRPGCSARPKPENVTKYGSGAEALLAGYRPCKRCLPLGEVRPGRTGQREAFNAALQAFVRRKDVVWREEAEVVAVARLATPLGPMIGAATREHLVLLEFADRRMLRTQLTRVRAALGCNFAPGSNAVLRMAERQLDAYFAGRRQEFTVPMRTPGTPFQSRVWTALSRIPYGATRSYAQLAKTVRQPTAVRAVASANGDNRISILIPCHRVIGSDGSLTGYGGKLWRKRRLLALESGRAKDG